MASKGCIIILFEPVSQLPSTSSFMSDVWAMSELLNDFGGNLAEATGALGQWSFDGFEILLILNDSRCAVVLNQCGEVTTLINCIYANGGPDLLPPLIAQREAVSGFLHCCSVCFLFLCLHSSIEVCLAAPLGACSLHGNHVEVTWDEPTVSRGWLRSTFS